MSTQSIQSQDIKISEVFQGFYSVPDYQREYVWQSEQVEQLLTDIYGELNGSELDYAVGHGPDIAPGEPAAERGSFGEVVLVGRLREAIRGADLAIQSRTLATLRDTLLPKLLSGKLSMHASP